MVTLSNRTGPSHLESNVASPRALGRPNSPRERSSCGVSHRRRDPGRLFATQDQSLSWRLVSGARVARTWGLTGPFGERGGLPGLSETDPPPGRNIILRMLLPHRETHRVTRGREGERYSHSPAIDCRRPFPESADRVDRCRVLAERRQRFPGAVAAVGQCFNVSRRWNRGWMSLPARGGQRFNVLDRAPRSVARSEPSPAPRELRS